MDMDEDSDLGDMLNDLLASNEESECKPLKSETSLKELNFSFLNAASNSIEKTSPEKLTNSMLNNNHDSSDDEDKRYFEERKYSEGGREINDILKKEQFEKKDKLITREVLQDSKQSDFKNLSSNFSQSSISNESKKSRFHINLSAASTKTVPTPFDVYSDPIFGLRIVKPLISSTELKDRMLGRTPVTISKVKSHLATGNLQEDWVIAGVLIFKSSILKSQKGSQYCIWKISDLSLDMKVVSVFLFSGAYKALWKTETGVVVGILNPSVLEGRDDKDQATLSVDNAQRVMILGNSRDMGVCKSKTKSGNPCTSIVNKNVCEYCVFHVQKEYKQCSRRADIQSSANGRGLGLPPGFGNSRSKKVQPAIIQGPLQNFNGIPAKRNQKLFEKDQERLALLTGAKKIVKKEEKSVEDKLSSEKEIKTFGSKSSKLENGDEKVAKGYMVELSNNQSKKDFERLNKLKSLAKKEVNEGESSKDITILEETVDISSEKMPIVSSIPIKKDGFTLSKLQELNAKESPSFLSKTPGFTRSKLQEWTMKQGFGTSSAGDSSPKSLNLNCLSKSSKTKSPKTSSLAKSFNSFNNSSGSADSSVKTLSIPRLGSGLTSGTIDFSEPITKQQKDSAKLNALKWVREKGGLKKSNPNKILWSKEQKEQGLKRKREAEIEEEKDKNLKESKKLPNRFKELMETTSKHVNLIEKSEEEEKEKYFGKLEIKEKMEEKMMSTFKVPCKAVICNICRYTAFSSSDLCKEMNHPIKVVDAVKRFFKCGDCGNRTITLDKIPTLSCKKCSSSNWKRAAMMDEKRVAIPGTSLSIRGGEETFIGGDVSNANLNLLVPE